MSTTVAGRTAIVDTVQAALPSLYVHGDGNTDPDPPSNANWARVTIKDGAQGISGVGANRPLLRGPVVVFVDVFTRPNLGDSDAVTACGDVRAAFTSFQSNGLRFDRFEQGVEGLADGLYRKQQIIILSQSTRG